MKNKLPLVSICIPAYNSEKWIRTTIQSAINQTWLNKEIIVVDDGSTDNTLNILEEFNCDILKVVSQKNKGACAARNYALSISKGDFIQWLDADDLLASNKIELQLREIDFDINTKILLSSSCAKFYTHPDKAKFNPNLVWQDLTPKEWLIRHLKDGAIIYPHAWLVSRFITQKAGEWNEKLLLNQDGEYFCRVVAASNFVNFVGEAKCFYRTGNLSSISNRKSIRKLESLIEANILSVNHLLELENNSSTRNAGVVFLQKFLSKIYYEDNEIEAIKLVKDKIVKIGGIVPERKESTKFFILRSIFGLRIARQLKSKLWDFEIIVRRIWDKFMFNFFH